MTKRKYKYFVFDMDGTMEDTKDAVLAAYRGVAEKFGTGEYTDEYLYEKCFIRSATEGLINIGIKEEWMTEAMDDLNRFAYDNDIVVLYPHVKELIEGLYEKGAVLSICTSRSPVAFGYDRVFRPLKEYFTEIMHGEYAETPKPSPAPLLKYLEKYGIKKEEVLFIGDSTSDSRCASGSGVDFVLAVWSDCADTSLAAEAQYCPKDPLELLELVSD